MSLAQHFTLIKITLHRDLLIAGETQPSAQVSGGGGKKVSVPFNDVISVDVASVCSSTSTLTFLSFTTWAVFQTAPESPYEHTTYVGLWHIEHIVH